MINEYSEFERVQSNILTVTGMFRIAAFLIVFALAAPSMAGIVCGLSCEAEAASKRPWTSDCHVHHAADGPAIAATHVCNHDVNSAPFLTQGQDSRVNGDKAHFSLLATFHSDASRSLFATSGISDASPPGGEASPVSARPPVLRI